jgi:hypothetical protein
MKRSLSLVLFAAGWLCVAGCTPPATTPTAPVSGAPAGPQATVGDTEIFAGDVEYGLPRDYVFRVQNTGGTPLTLTTTYKSCQCAATEVPESIAPGKEGEIKIRWAPLPGNVDKYIVTLKVQTNEPRELVFQVKSFIKSKVRVILPENLSYIDFGDKALQAGEVYTRDVKVFSPDLINFNLEAHCSIEGFNVVKTPLPPDSLIGDTMARSGYVVSLSTTDKLAPGYIHGELSLMITAQNEKDEKEERKIVVDLYANRSNIEFGVSPDQVAFRQPKITDADSKDVLIQFTSSPTGKETLELVSVEPKWLKVTAPQRRGDKGLWIMNVQIPPDNPEARACQAVSEMDGQIVLKSNKSEAPVAVRVKWRPVK